jgi:hypothetical protein
MAAMDSSKSATSSTCTCSAAGAQSTSQCLFYNCQGHAVYTLAGLGVVYSKPPQHSQHFFLGHNDDVKSLALCPAAVQFADQEYPARSLAATGQVGCAGLALYGKAFKWILLCCTSYACL